MTAIKLNSYRPTVAEVNISALVNNVQKLKDISKSSLFMGVVKANAFGHGIVESSRIILEAGANRLGVSLVEEGVVLREAGIDAPIHVISSVLPDQAKDMVEHDLIAAVSSYRMAEVINKEAMSKNKKIKAHLKIDVGLHRFGILPEDAMEFCEKTFYLENLDWEGIFTHLPAADDGEWELTENQVKCFTDLVQKLEYKGYVFPLKHVGGSTITIERPDMHFDMVRPGIALYGYCPAPRQLSVVELEQVMTIKSRVVHVTDLPPESPIGYGGAYLTKRDTRIATIPLGFGDGYSREVTKSNKAQVLIGGKRYNVAGKVSLDQILVDLDGNREIDVGAEVVLLGSQKGEKISGYEFAAWMGGIPDQVVSTLTARMRREYV